MEKNTQRWLLLPNLQQLQKGFALLAISKDIIICPPKH
jgi:hypothetical protein